MGAASKPVAPSGEYFVVRGAAGNSFEPV